MNIAVLLLKICAKLGAIVAVAACAFALVAPGARGPGPTLPAVSAQGPTRPTCDPSRPLPERVRDSHWRWFEGERMADCDADVLVEAADALETCEVGP